MKKNNLILIEDHHQALDAWRKEKFTNLFLVHLDAHIDFGFYRAKHILPAIEEAKSVEDLKKQLESTLLYKTYRDDLEAQLNIGNYIYPAMRDSIVNRFYWVLPGDKKEFKNSLGAIRRQIKRLRAQNPNPYRREKIAISKERVIALLYKNYFEATNLFSIQKIRKPILLDIDVDFLLLGSIKNISLTKNLGRRKPWIYPKRLVKIIRGKFSKIAHITIAYSVNGGFTPLGYKFFGDEISLRLTNLVDKRLENIISLRDKGITEFHRNNFRHSIERFKEAVIKLKDHNKIDKISRSHFFAHLYFWLFNIYWKLEQKQIARGYYQKLLKEDLNYRTKDNNLGPLYLRKKDLNSAQKEFEKILYCDPLDYFSLCGLGNIFFQRKKYNLALDKFRQALKINPKEKDALFGIVGSQIELNRLPEAKKTLLTLKKIEPFNGSRFMLEGRLNKKLGNLKKALSSYKEAVMLGKGGIELYEDVFKILSVEKDNNLLEFFKERYRSFRDNFYKNQKKKILLEGKRKNEIQKLEKGFKRIDKIKFLA